MKLRQLMTNSLQRSRTKSKDKKKKEESEKDKKKKPSQEEKGRLFSTPWSNKESTPSRKRTKDSTCFSQPQRSKSDVDSCGYNRGSKFHDYATIDYNAIKSRIHSHDYCFSEDKLSSFHNQDVINVNFNINSTDPKCACCKHMDTPIFSPDATELYPTGELQNSFLSDNSNYNSLPKNRSRIKTNPWLPSPRATPTPSMASSMTSSPGDSPADGRSFEVDPGDVLPGLEYGESLNMLNITADRRGQDHFDSISAHFDDVDSVHIMQRSFTSDTDNEFYSFPPAYRMEMPLDSSSMENLCSGISDVALSEKSAEPEPKVSFEYEEAFESQMESTKIGRVYGSRDILDYDAGSNDNVFYDDTGSIGNVCGIPARRSQTYIDSDGKERRRPFLILRCSKRFEDESEETDDTLKGRPSHHVYM